MAYGPFYGITDWKNEPSQETPINRTNLLHMENGIKESDNRIVQLDAKKAEQALVNTLVKEITLDPDTGIMTVTQQNGTVTTYDLAIEKVVANFDINDDNELVLTLADGTQKVIDLTRFVYSVDSTATITMKILNRTITAEIVDGSVTMEKLDASIQMEFRQYMLDAQAARDMALQYQNNAKTFRDQTEVIANDAVTDIAAVGGRVDETLTEFNTLLMNGYFNGPMGPQGQNGEQGKRGADAVVTQANGAYAFQIREDGHLYVLFSDAAADPPPVHINEVGHFIVRLGG
ncbi:hypothetical protein [Lacrimispora sp.]|uniref:hypothetical protein n=1 Tax=Lacrimispora sp. TaxID=2719234 RepID=UPI0028AECADE|nr:hypothetical protein [Lacrimispora sp.]